MVKRILLVEDNEIHRLLTEEFLTYQGYKVFGLPDGVEFFAAIAAFSPDLILLDLNLPNISGFELLEQFSQSAWASIPVIVVSAYAFEREQQKARELGVSHYLTKPMSLKMLANTIEAELFQSVAYLSSRQTSCRVLLG
ncbi:response regulator [Oculatella sp. LEGE 06141]|uniref:response regulator n=1 Tax=Oculatella sp. LEGE 06141 TaxID=1828648 RepID=UPI00187EEFC3|nr:response regulator [Oculatella sp. LEGE 06141]MBE9183059.1 response regulator [Oculatella sp. LEGE 06141]